MYGSTYDSYGNSAYGSSAYGSPAYGGSAYDNSAYSSIYGSSAYGSSTYRGFVKEALYIITLCTALYTEALCIALRTTLYTEAPRIKALDTKALRMQALYATLYIITSIWCVDLACFFCEVRQGFHVFMHTSTYCRCGNLGKNRQAKRAHRSSPKFVWG